MFRSDGARSTWHSAAAARGPGILLLAILVGLGWTGSLPAGERFTGPVDGNRLTYLDSSDPYYPQLGLARLTTPQWVGEPGVEAVVVLAIDDMRGHEPWEAYLRPLLERLKQIDGRAPLSIMTCQVDPAHPHLQTWLREGLSLEIHTIDHPCPLLANSDLAQAKSTYDRCVDLLASVPGNRPVAFRMPCCDSLNTASPRFFAEIFNRRTPGGRFLEIDSSVFVLLTADDPALPRELVWNPDGSERFRRYVPFAAYANTIENYPYPYPIGRLCWEFPCLAPSDWSAQHVQRPANPRTVTDWQAALDAIVTKQGVMNLVFHPYDWIRAEQVMQLVDHAVSRHGPRVKFLSFREAADRLAAHALGGDRLRAADGGDAGVRLIDLDADGHLDVVIGRQDRRLTRVWRPRESRWDEGEFPVAILAPRTGEQPESTALDAGVRWGVFHADGRASCLLRNEHAAGAWHFDGRGWIAAPELLAGLELDGQPLWTSRAGLDRGVRLVDLDGDGVTELLAAHPEQSGAWQWQPAVSGQPSVPGQPEGAWRRLPWTLPPGAWFADAAGHDGGLRLVDVDDDGRLDLVFSHAQGSGVYLWRGLEAGFSLELLRRRADEPGHLPLVVRGDTNNGAWFHDRHLVVQNEDTARLPHLVERQPFNAWLGDLELSPREPDQALAGLRPRPGFRVELVAAEPLVADPVGFDWDEQGRLWVVEMADYPLGLDNQGQIGGRVRLLTDDNRDGRYDRATILRDDLPYPTGICTWRDGCLVSAAPEIVFLADRDGDGRAEVREVLYRGLSEGNQQHRANGFTRGLDNWLYCGNGHSGGTLVSSAGGEPLEISGRDFRVRPADGACDVLLGVTQFQRAQSDGGHWFGNNNIEPLFQFVIEDEYLRRNPHVAPGQVVFTVPELPGTAPVYPRSRTLERFNDYHTANRFTSACGTILYRDELYGPEFAGNSFVSEPVHNLVHREIVGRQGPRFVSRRADDERASEFLASTDNWFRPTFLATAPDGCLWIADMYRAVIEHPEWIPDEREARLNVRGGSDRGRIYRLVRLGSEPRPIPRLADHSPAELVAELESPNGWLRDKAQELLVARRDGAKVEPLRRLVRSGARGTARLHALWTLEGLGELDEPSLLAGLGDAAPDVRRQALRLSESRFDHQPQLLAAAVALVADRDADVRMQLALSLGASRLPEAGQALAQLTTAAETEELVLTAAITALVPHAATLAAQWVQAPSDAPPPPPAVLAAVVDVTVATNDRPALESLVRLISTEPAAAAGESLPVAAGPAWRWEAVARLVEALDRRGQTIADLEQRIAGAGLGLAQLTERLIAGAAAVAGDESQAISARVQGLRLLGRLAGDRPATLDRALALIDSRNPPELQATALAALDDASEPSLGARLVAAWPTIGPGLRAGVLELLFKRDPWVDACLAGLESNGLLAAEVDATHRQRLLAHRRPEVRRRAATIWADRSADDRRAVVTAHHDVLSLEGNPERGAQWFDNRCGVCHRLGERGFAVGPNLGPLANKPPEALLEAVLDPNRAVEAPYVNYVAVTTDGRSFTGLVAAETSTAITLRAQQGKDQVLLRTEIDTLESTGKSLMPEGLERDLTKQQLADVLAFLRGAAPEPKAFAGNRPEPVRPDELRGELSCLSTNARIFGESLVFEEENRNLGFWGSPDDHASWTLEVARPGDYDVLLEWASPPESAGNAFVFELGDERITHRVDATDGWHDYRRARVGQVRLSPGRISATLRPAGPMSGYLFDFRSLTLRPRRLSE